MKLQLFLDGNTWKGAKFPEELPQIAPPNGPGRIFSRSKKEVDEYNAAVEKAKAEALEVINPEMLSPYIFKFSGGYAIQNGILEAEKVVPGVLYPWDGEWEIVTDMEHADDGPHAVRKIRLLPKSPVIPEGSKDEFDRFMVCGPKKKKPMDLSKFGEKIHHRADDGTIKSGKRKSSGIVATGIPEPHNSDKYIPQVEVDPAHTTAQLRQRLREANKEIARLKATHVNAFRKETFEQCLRFEFLFGTENYPREYHKLFESIFKRAEDRFKSQPSPQAESQESIWKDVEFYLIKWSDQELDYEEAQRLFSIARKPFTQEK